MFPLTNISHAVSITSQCSNNRDQAGFQPLKSLATAPSSIMPTKAVKILRKLTVAISLAEPRFLTTSRKMDQTNGSEANDTAG